MVLDLYSGAREALRRVSDRYDIPCALVSRTHRAAWAREWLRLLRVDAERAVVDVITRTPPIVVIRDGAKTNHLREVVRQVEAAEEGVAFEDVLFFDDSLPDCLAAEKALGVVAIHCKREQGFTVELLEEGLDRFALSRERRGED